MENKLYLDNGEIIDFSKCSVCDSTFQVLDIKEVQDTNIKYTNMINIIRKNIKAATIHTLKYRKCNCGVYPDITIETV